MPTLVLRTRDQEAEVPTLTASRDGRKIIFTQGESVTLINLAYASP